MLSLLSLLISLLLSSTDTGASSCEPCLLRAETNFVIATAEDKDLGPVNLCDPDGKVCLEGNAYLDSNNGRIYVTNVRPHVANKYYSQRSNDKRWPWMIRYNDKWYYFDF